MTPSAQGRYCAACQHTVIYFRHLTDGEMLALLLQASGRRVCGRFRAEQLDRALVHAPVAAPRWQAWLLAAAAAWGLRSALPAAASAQTLQLQHPGPPVPTPGSVPASAETVTPAHPTADSRRVWGLVVDPLTQEPLPGVNVLLVGTTTRVSGSPDGHFELDAPGESCLLQVSAIGFESRRVALPPGGQALRVGLKRGSQILWGEVAIVGPRVWYSPRGLWWRARGLAQRLARF